MKGRKTNQETAPSPDLTEKEFLLLKNLWTKISNVNYKLVYFASIAIIAGLILFMSSKTAVNGDAPIDFTYGKVALEFYLSNGNDTSCLDLMVGDKNINGMRYYGSGFEVTYAIIDKLVNPDDTYLLRMYYLGIWGVILLFFMGLIGKELSNWRGALLALWLAFLSPFLLGNILGSTKDIPFALGFAITIYFMLRFYRQLPKITIPNIIGIAIGIALSISIRIGGLLTICYFGLFLLLSFLKPSMLSLFKEKKWKTIVKIGFIGLGIVIAGFFLGMIFYPNFLAHGFTHIVESFQRMSDFNLNTPFVFEGEQVFSKNLPKYFLPKMFFITTPILHILLVVIALPLMIIRRNQIGIFNLLIVLFTIIFPFVYTISIDATVYNAWRHILFCYVAFPALLAACFVNLIDIAPKIPLKAALLILLIIPMVELLAWNIKNAPYQLAFYNQFVGGVEGAYARYDFDMVHFAAPIAAKKLMKTLSPEDFSEEKPLKIAITNEMISKYIHIPKEWKDKVVFNVIFYKEYAVVECDYAVLSLQFTTPVMRTSFFPPKGTIMKETVDGVPIACVVDRREDLDYRGIRKTLENKSEEGLELLKKAYEYNPQNFSLYYWLGLAYFKTGDSANAIKFLEMYEKRYPNDKDAHRMLGYSQYVAEKYTESLNSFRVVFVQVPSDMEIAYMIGLCYYQKKDYERGEQFLNQVIAQNPNFENGKQLLNVMRMSRSY